MEIVPSVFGTSLLSEHLEIKSVQNVCFHMEIVPRVFGTSLLSEHLEMEKEFKT